MAKLLSMAEVEDLERLLALDLNVCLKNYHWQNEVDYNQVFGLDQFGVRDSVRRLVATARAYAELREKAEAAVRALEEAQRELQASMVKN